MEGDQQIAGAIPAPGIQSMTGVSVPQGQSLDTTVLLQMILQQQQQQQQLQSQLITALANQQQNRDGDSRSDAVPQIKSLPVPKLASPDNLRLPQFRAWRTRWEDHINSQKLQRHPIATQQAVLRSALDEEWVMLWTSERFPIDAETTTYRIISLFEEYLRKRRNPLLDRQEFFLRSQQQGESVDRYYASLRILDDACSHELDILCPACNQLCTARCNNPACETDEVLLFPLLQQTRLRDRLICGLTDKELQRKILAKQYVAIVNLEAVLSICSAQEQSDAAGTALSKPGASTVNAVAKSSYKRQQSPSRFVKPLPLARRDPVQGSSGTAPCYWCGKYDEHERNECPALNHKCAHCKIRGHWEKVCRNPNRRPRHRSLSPSRSPSNSTPGRSSSVARPYRANTIRISSTTKNSDCTLLPINVTSADYEGMIDFLCDTGADADLMPFTLFMILSRDACFQETFEFGGPVMEAANNSTLRIYGKLSATLRLNKKIYTTEIFICHDIRSPILSKTGCERLGLISKHWPHSAVSTINAISSGIPEVVVKEAAVETGAVKEQLMKEYAAVFDDEILKPMQGPPMHISLIEGAIPSRRYKAYTIPIHWKEAVKNQFDAMESKGVIEKVPVGESYDWCHPIVVVPKKGTAEPRITVDLTRLNQFVRRPAYPTRVPRDVVATIPPNQKYFTTMNSRHGYWQVPLDDDSKKLTTFITPWGSYRFCRNVMGLISAGDEHNRRGDEALAGISSVKKVVEDIIIHDANLDTHVDRVRQVLQRCLDRGITLNSKKFVFAQPEVDYCGFTLNHAGYTPAQHLVSALSNFPVPTSKTDIRSVMGLVQQFESFSSKLAALSQPLRGLLPKNAAFVWESPHQNAFQAVLAELASPRVLTHFTPGQPLRLETDAAQSKGLGFALWQQQPDSRWKLLQARSRFVTPTESHYSATEIECLAVTWAVRK